MKKCLICGSNIVKDKNGKRVTCNGMFSNKSCTKIYSNIAKHFDKKISSLRTQITRLKNPDGYFGHF